MELGVFIPIGNNGWLISTTSPQYKPSFDLNREIVAKAERFGFDFALSMIKLHGFGGPSQFWDYNLESFTLMAGLAAVTSRIQLFATCAVLTLPPPIAARLVPVVHRAAPSQTRGPRSAGEANRGPRVVVEVCTSIGQRRRGQIVPENIDFGPS